MNYHENCRSDDSINAEKCPGELLADQEPPPPSPSYIIITSLESIALIRGVGGGGGGAKKLTTTNTGEEDNGDEESGDGIIYYRYTVNQKSGVLSRLWSTAVAPSDSEVEATQQVVSICNRLVDERASRSFAIVHLLGKQWRVSDGDLLVVEGYWPPNVGDKITLDKVLLAATKDFSLIGRPLVQPGLVTVTATVVSKALSHTRTHFKKKRRKQYMRINFQRAQQTMLRINSVDIGNNINSPKRV